MAEKDLLTIGFDEDNLKAVHKFVAGKDLVDLMAEKGMEFEEIAFVVQTLFDRLSEVAKELQINDYNPYTYMPSDSWYEEDDDENYDDEEFD